MDSIPMIVISGQQVTWMLGKDAFQEADTFGLTMPVVKHNYLVRETNELPRAAKEAYHIATTGRPGPVLIDIPKDVSQSEFTGDLDPEIDLPGYDPKVAFNIDKEATELSMERSHNWAERSIEQFHNLKMDENQALYGCLLYTSPSQRD